MREMEYYLVICSDDTFEFFPKTTNGLYALADFYKNDDNRFFDITINGEFKLKYGKKNINFKNDMPNLNED